MITSAFIKRSFDYIVVETPFHRGWVKAIKHMVPPAHRDWNGQVWTFTDKYYPAVLAVTKHFFGGRITDKAGGPTDKLKGWENKWYHFLAMTNTHGDAPLNTRRSKHADLYDVLGIADGAKPSLVKKAWRELSKVHHPDAGGDEEMMKIINDAYRTLKEKGLAE